MNRNFIDKVNKSGITAYRLSKETGIPYTTISELCNSKTDINKCSAATVYKLALFFDCDIRDILNYIDPLENYSGIYKKHKFKWNRTGENDSLVVEKNGTTFVVDVIPEAFTNRPNEFKRALTEMLIDNFLEEKEQEKIL